MRTIKSKIKCLFLISKILQQDGKKLAIVILFFGGNQQEQNATHLSNYQKERHKKSDSYSDFFRKPLFTTLPLKR